MLIAETSTDDARPRPGSGSVIYVAPDCTDSAVQKRVNGFHAEGTDLVCFSFRRSRYNADFVPDWQNVELGATTEQRLLSRMFALLSALRVIYTHRRLWRRASMLYARNLDLALLASIGRVLTRSSAPFVYEVLDIHPATTKRGIGGALVRWLERRVLARCRLLVVSSPAFLRNYFIPIQHYCGESFLLENKWPHAEMSPLPRRIPYQREGREPKWTIGWFGNIRCPQSLAILTELADSLPGRVQVYIRGCVSLLGERRLREAIGDRENMVFEGEYRAPDELPAIYSKIHFNWCVDLCGAENSLWLLPNRLYEGGYFGIPALAIGSHETGRMVRRHQLGISLETPIAQHLCDILSTLTWDQYDRMRRQIEELPERNFVDQGDLARLMRIVLAQDGGNDACQGVRHLQHDPVGGRG